jgi:transposase
MSEITTVGLDLAKNVFQVHGVDAVGATVLRRQLRRAQVLVFFSRLPRCLVGWRRARRRTTGRELRALGHEVRLMPAQYVKAYVKRNKNDAADAEAICEAVVRPTMRFVPVKTAEQQAAVLLHRSRERLVRQRTMLVNALRAHLAEGAMVVERCTELKTKFGSSTGARTLSGFSGDIQFCTRHASRVAAEPYRASVAAPDVVSRPS